LTKTLPKQGNAKAVAVAAAASGTHHCEGWMVIVGPPIRDVSVRDLAESPHGVYTQVFSLVNVDRTRIVDTLAIAHARIHSKEGVVDVSAVELQLGYMT